MDEKEKKEHEEALMDRLKKHSELPNEFQFLTYQEFAVIMKVQVGTVRRWVSTGEIKERVKMGPHVLIPLSEARRFVAERTISKGK